MKKLIINKEERDFQSWQETHFEIVSAIVLNIEKSKRVKEVSETQGTGGLYELAEELTDKFEEKYKDKEWDGEYFCIIEEFIEEELFTN